MRQFQSRRLGRLLAGVGPCMAGLCFTTALRVDRPCARSSVSRARRFSSCPPARWSSRSLSRSDTPWPRAPYISMRLRGGEALVHHLIILAATSSCVLPLARLTLGSRNLTPAGARATVPFLHLQPSSTRPCTGAGTITGKSDCRRYLGATCSSSSAGVMMAGWWLWYGRATRAIAETLVALFGAPGRRGRCRDGPRACVTSFSC